MVVVGVLTQGEVLSTPTVVVSRVGPATRGAATREEEDSRVVVASMGAAALLRAAGRGLVVAAIMPIKVTLNNLVWEVGKNLWKEKVVAWGA
jgi:hypothetical protein